MVSESKVHLFFIFALIFLLQIHISAGQNAVKAAYWSAKSEFPVSSINSSLFTHLFCAFADLDPQTNGVVVSSENQARFSTFTQTVQQKNPSVKTLLSIGGGNSSLQDAFASMVSQSSSRKSFIDSSISLARSYGFHGLDLDWEYPDTTAKMSNLGLLLNEWRAAVASESTSSGKPRLLLSAAVFRNKDYYTINYPIQAISNSLDWINVMAYDFYGPGWSPTSTGPPAALYNPGTQVSGDYGITSWIQAGVPSTKIVLGFPFYGWAWRLLNANNHGLFSPANGSALPGDGDIGYGRIKTFISQNRATTVYNATVVSNYCYSGTTWIGYDDTQSISAKVSYAKGKKLLGYFAWHAGADDNNWTLSKQALSTWGA